MPELVLGLIGVGERTGQLALCTGYLLEYYRRMAELRRRLAQSLTYPILVLVLIWGVLGLFDGLIKGVFVSLYASAEMGLPASLTSLFILVHGLFLAPVLLVPLVLFGVWIARRSGMRLPGVHVLAERLMPRLIRRMELERLFLPCMSPSWGDWDCLWPLHWPGGVCEANNCVGTLVQSMYLSRGELRPTTHSPIPKYSMPRIWGCCDWVHSLETCLPHLAKSPMAITHKSRIICIKFRT